MTRNTLNQVSLLSPHEISEWPSQWKISVIACKVLFHSAKMKTQSSHVCNINYSHSTLFLLPWCICNMLIWNKNGWRVLYCTARYIAMSTSTINNIRKHHRWITLVLLPSRKCCNERPFHRQFEPPTKRDIKQR